MSFATTAAIVGAAATAASVGYTLSGAGSPSMPNLAQSSVELAQVNAQLLPIQRALTAAAQQGRSITIDIPAHTSTEKAAWVPTLQTTTIGGRTVSIPKGGEWVPYDPAEWKAGGKYNPDGTTAAPRLDTRNIKVPAGKQTFDFTGYGEADVKGQLAKAMAKVQLAIGQKYNSQFIDQALAQEELADPQSFAARRKMNDLIQEQIDRPLNAPVADELSRQVREELSASGRGGLDQQMQDLLMKGGNAALSARGGSGTVLPDFEQPLTSGSAGTMRQLGAIGKATSNLASGQTPEDIAYRREQQDLGNLAAFVAGKTPQSQFDSLSGAQKGPTPFIPGTPGPVMPNNSAGAQGAALNSWQTQMNAAANQTPDWMAGLSALLGIGKTAANLGWQPGQN